MRSPAAACRTAACSGSLPTAVCRRASTWRRSRVATPLCWWHRLHVGSPLLRRSFQLVSIYRPHFCGSGRPYGCLAFLWRTWPSVVCAPVQGAPRAPGGFTSDLRNKWLGTAAPTACMFVWFSNPLQCSSRYSLAWRGSRLLQSMVAPTDVPVRPMRGTNWLPSRIGSSRILSAAALACQRDSVIV